MRSACEFFFWRDRVVDPLDEHELFGIAGRAQAGGIPLQQQDVAAGESHAAQAADVLPALMLDAHDFDIIETVELQVADDAVVEP